MYLEWAAATNHIEVTVSGGPRHIFRHFLLSLAFSLPAFAQATSLEEDCRTEMSPDCLLALADQDLCRIASERPPAELESYVLAIAQAHNRTGDRDGALRTLDKIGPSEAKMNALLSSGEYEEALDVAAQIYDPKYVEWIFANAMVITLLKNGDTDHAIAVVTSEAFRETWVPKVLAFVLALRGDVEGSIALFGRRETFEEIEEDVGSALAQLIWLQGIEETQGAIRRLPTSDWRERLLAMALEASQNIGQHAPFVTENSEAAHKAEPIPEVVSRLETLVTRGEEELAAGRTAAALATATEAAWAANPPFYPAGSIQGQFRRHASELIDPVGRLALLFHRLGVPTKAQTYLDVAEALVAQYSEHRRPRLRLPLLLIRAEADYPGAGPAIVTAMNQALSIRLDPDEKRALVDFTLLVAQRGFLQEAEEISHALADAEVTGWAKVSAELIATRIEQGDLDLAVQTARRIPQLSARIASSEPVAHALMQADRTAEVQIFLNELRDLAYAEWKGSAPLAEEDPTVSPLEVARIQFDVRLAADAQETLQQAYESALSQGPARRIPTFAVMAELLGRQ